MRAAGVRRFTPPAFGQLRLDNFHSTSPSAPHLFLSDEYFDLTGIQREGDDLLHESYRGLYRKARGTISPRFHFLGYCTTVTLPSNPTSIPFASVGMFPAVVFPPGQRTHTRFACPLVIVMTCVALSCDQ